MKMTRFSIVNNPARGYVLYDRTPPKPLKAMFQIDIQVPVNEDNPDAPLLPEEGVVIRLDGSDIRDTIRNFITKAKGRSVGSQMMR